MSDTRIKYQNYRLEIEDVVNALSDISYQKKYWKYYKFEPKEPICGFKYSYNILFDDLPGLAEDPHSTIGDYLIDEREADAMAALIAPLDRLLNRYGVLMTPQQAWADPLWETVVEKAKILRAIFKESAFVPPTAGS